MTVEAADHSTAIVKGVNNSTFSAPQENTSDTVRFRRKNKAPDLVMSTGITKDHLERIANWEMSIWGEQGRGFDGSVGQFKQELSESRDVWIKVVEEKASLGDEDIIHKLREEIGDGIISNIGLLRQLEPDNDVAANFIYRSVYESSKSKRRSRETSIALYQLKGQRLLERIDECGQDCVDRLSGRDRNEIKMMVGSVMKAGFEALDKLGIDTETVVSDKVRIVSKFKYSPQRVQKKGSVEAAKKDWEMRQLPVVNGGVLYEDLKVA